MTVKQGVRALAATLALLFCIILLPPALTGAAQAEDTGAQAASRAAAAQKAGRRVVRVGLPDAEIVAVTGGENRSVAFQKDYMQAVSEYANWECDYVEAPWGECLEMAKSGELDILMDVSKTQERQAYFNYASESMGTEICYLYARSDTPLQYDDFAGFNGMTVGYEEGSLIIDSLRQYGRSGGFTFAEKAYSSGVKLFEALDGGEVDAVVLTSFYEAPAGHVILAKCSPTPVYIVTGKSNLALMRELDSAMAQLLSYNPNFNAELYQYHFGNVSSQTAGYTRQEANYLSQKPTVNVFYETSWEPFEYENNGAADGITPDIIRAIGEDTGITFRFVKASSTQDVYEGVGGAASDTVMAVSYDYNWANTHNLLVTQPYVTGSVMRVTQSGSTAVRTAATVKDTYLENQVHVKYPTLQTVSYLTYAECVDAVAHGKADCTFLNYHQASYYRVIGSYAGFSYQPDEAITQGISLGVTRDSNPALFGVLSKSLQRISANDAQRILSENATGSGELSVQALVRRYPLQSALLTGLFVSLVGLLVVLTVTSNARKRQNVQLAAAKRGAETANNAKSDFLSRMSHDMRTPLNGIIGMTYLTSRMELPPAAQENLQKIDISSKFLLSLINDLLDMTKAESGKIELHPEPYPPQDFEKYIDAVILPLCQSRHQKLTLDIEMPEDAVPLFDRLRINQVVFNLLSNAVKYTPEEGRITYLAHSRLLPADKLAMHIECSDTGIGMSEEFQKVVFTPFSQEARNDRSELRGSGLGLAITKRLVELMGGTISFQSTPGTGTVFIVDFVVDCVHGAPADDAAQAKPDAAVLATLGGRHVLLCEDQPLNQVIASTLLCEKGMSVDLAQDGRQGVEKFSASAPGYYDVVLMDIRMPEMNGYEATRTIRALPRPDAQTVPILAMSADVLSADVQKCLETGMNGHIAKPVDPQAMYQQIAQAITAAQKAHGAQ